jgi:WD40 repeat protein
VFANLTEVNANESTALAADFTEAVLDRSSWKRARLLRVTTVTPQQKQTMDLRGAAVEGETSLELRWPMLASASGAVAWSPDGSLLARGHEDGSVRLYKVETGEELLALRGHEYYVTSVAWSPDSKRLASGSSDNTVRLWELESRALLAFSPRCFAQVRQVAWHPKGRWLLSSCDDGAIRIWDTMVMGDEDTGRSGRSSRKRMKPVKLRCVATIYAVAFGWLATRPDGRLRFGGDLASEQIFGAGLCRLSTAEAIRLYPELLLENDDPLFSIDES